MITRFYCTNRMILTATDNTSGITYRTNFENRYIDLEEALEKAQEFFEFDGCDHADIINAETGELLAVCDEFIEADDIEEDEEFEDYMDEVGFDPYEGCYTWDC